MDFNETELRSVELNMARAYLEGWWKWKQEDKKFFHHHVYNSMNRQHNEVDEQEVPEQDHQDLYPI